MSEVLSKSQMTEEDIKHAVFNALCQKLFGW